MYVLYLLYSGQKMKLLSIVMRRNLSYWEAKSVLRELGHRTLKANGCDRDDMRG